MGLGDIPAYPQSIDVDKVGYRHSSYDIGGQSGMTIRQRYAMAAMQGYASQGWSVPSIIANQAFDVADAMIAFEEREHEEKLRNKKI
jgi:hypothetical protein